VAGVHLLAATARQHRRQVPDEVGPGRVDPQIGEHRRPDQTAPVHGEQVPLQQQPGHPVDPEPGRKGPVRPPRFDHHRGPAGRRTRACVDQFVGLGEQ
jgi:hypothetical protein